MLCDTQGSLISLWQPRKSNIVWQGAWGCSGISEGSNYWAHQDALEKSRLKVMSRATSILIVKDHLGDWSPEKDCSWQLMFQQSVWKPSSESSDSFSQLKIQKPWSIDIVAIGKRSMWVAVKTCVQIGYVKRWVARRIINNVLLFPVERLFVMCGKRLTTIEGSLF